MAKNRLSAHFSRSEAACHCGCGFRAADIELVSTLEEIRLHFQAICHPKPIIIKVLSWCRCKKHNKAVGGAKHSRHVLAEAVDFSVRFKNDTHKEAVPAREVYRYLCKKFPYSHGIGLYRTFVHLDIRNRKARWHKL